MAEATDHLAALKEVRAVLVKRRRNAAERFTKEVGGMPALTVAPIIDIQNQIAVLDVAIADEERLRRSA